MASTPDNNILTTIEAKVDLLNRCACLLSLNSMSLGIAVDVCRSTKYFELLLKNWEECLPLGEARDVNFAMWGNKLWEMMRKVSAAYGLQRVAVSPYKYESESYIRFQELQQRVDIYDSSLEVLRQVDGDDVPIILMCSLRALSEVMMKISEFLNSPTEELIAMSYEKWVANYKKHYQKSCRNGYKKWKLQYTQRTLKKHLLARLKTELDSFKQTFISNDDEFELVYDAEQKTIDIDGLSRFLFTHVERFGVSHIDVRPMLSPELIALFNYVEIWKLIRADLHPTQKNAQKQLADKDSADKEMKEMTQKLLTHTAKLETLFGENWWRWQRLCEKVCMDKELLDKLKKVSPQYNEWNMNQKLVCNLIGLFKQQLNINVSIAVVNSQLCNKNIRSYISKHKDYSGSSSDLSKAQHERIEKMLDSIKR
jgi:hypothetical protein